MSATPLKNKRVLITRTKTQAKHFAEKISNLGGEPVIIPLISIVSAANEEPLISAMKNIQHFDWLVLTSQNGVDAFFSVFNREHIKNEQIKGLKIAVVGSKTMQAVENIGLGAHLMPEHHYTAEALAEALLGKVKKGERVLMARGNLARNVLPENLMKNGIDVVDVIAYETIMNTEGQNELIKELHEEKLDVITFTSSSTVNHFVQLVKEIDWKTKLRSVCLAAIGPITASTMRHHGLTPDVVAKINTTDGLLDEVISYLNSEAL